MNARCDSGVFSGINVLSDTPIRSSGLYVRLRAILENAIFQTKHLTMQKSNNKLTNVKPIRVPMDPETHEAVKRQAKREGMLFTAWILRLVRRSLGLSDEVPPAALRAGKKSGTSSAAAEREGEK